MKEPTSERPPTDLDRVLDRANVVLGDKEKASAWLRRPNRALGGSVPLHLLNNEAGARRVEEILARMEELGGTEQE